MASDLRGWETDPLFAAAEVVQDSADRMGTIYRSVMHESSLIDGDHPAAVARSSLKLHRRDLLTAIETTKWQLEDFEKAASLSIIRSKLRTREILMARYRQFVEAIREQIFRIEKNLDYSSLRDAIVDTSHADEDNLECFLSGVVVNRVHQDRLDGHDTKDGSLFRGLLDVAGASCSAGSTDEIFEEKTEDMGNLGVKGDANGIHNTSKLNASIGAKNGDWDLEASSSTCEIFQRNKFGELVNRMSIFLNFIGSISTSSSYGSWISRNYTKKLKDEEQRHSLSLNIFQHAKSNNTHGRRWNASTLNRFQGMYSLLTTRISHSSNHRYACMKRKPIQSIVTMIFAALFLGVMVLQVSQM